MVFGKNIEKLSKVSYFALNNTIDSLNALQYELEKAAENTKKTD